MHKHNRSSAYGYRRCKIASVPDLSCRDGLCLLLGFPGRLVHPVSGRIQSGILWYLGGPDRSREGGVMGCFWSSAEGRTRVKPDLVMLQPPAPPAPRPPSARHVTAGELQENAEGLRWKSHRQVPNRPWSQVCWHGPGQEDWVAHLWRCVVIAPRLLTAVLHEARMEILI